MDRNNDQISSAQLGAVITTLTIGVGVLSIPRIVTEKAGPDGWILILLGSILTLMTGLLITALVKKFPKQTLVEFSGDIIGKPLGLIVSLGFVVYCIIFTAVEVRIFGEAMKTYLLLNTPIEVLMITLLAVSAYLVRSGIEPIGRMSQIVFPMVIGTAVIVILPIVPEVDWTNLLPVLKTPLPTIIKSLPVVFFSFIGIESIMIFSAFVKDPKDIKKNIYSAIGMVAFVYFFIVIITVSRFGLIETTHIIWPGLEIFKTVDVPGAFLENIDGYIMAIWIFIGFMTVVVTYFGASLTLSRILKSKEQNYFVLPILPVIYYVAILPDSLVETFDYMDMLGNYGGTFYMILLPVLLLGIYGLRKGNGQPLINSKK